MNRALRCLSLAGLLLLPATLGVAKIVKTKSAPKASRELVVGSRIESESSEFVAPLLVEWSPTKRLQVSMEAAYTRVQLDAGGWVSGLQDLEASAVYELLPERRQRTSLALELDLKLPTSSNRELGTGKADYGIGAVLTKEFVHYELEASAVYTFVGSPRGQSLPNVYELSVAGEWHATPRLDFLAELVASGGGNLGGHARNGFGLGGVQSAVAERGGTEVEATLGIAEHVTRHLKLEQGASFKSDGTLLAIVGWEYDFGAGN